MELCQELEKQPHEDLVPVIHLSAHSVRRSIEEAQQMHGIQATQAAAVAGTNSENTAQEPKRAVKLPPDDLYVSVVCNNVTATLHPASCRVRAKGEEMSATHFEQYAGCGSAKKWRASVKLVPGQVPECPEGAHPDAYCCSFLTRQCSMKVTCSCCGQSQCGLTYGANSISPMCGNDSNSSRTSANVSRQLP
jgi:hypothetical protein